MAKVTKTIEYWTSDVFPDFRFENEKDMKDFDETIQSEEYYVDVFKECIDNGNGDMVFENINYHYNNGKMTLEIDTEAIFEDFLRIYLFNENSFALSDFHFGNYINNEDDIDWDYLQDFLLENCKKYKKAMFETLKVETIFK